VSLYLFAPGSVACGLRNLSRLEIWINTIRICFDAAHRAPRYLFILFIFPVVLFDSFV
jgi:hypothetical protein